MLSDDLKYKILGFEDYLNKNKSDFLKKESLLKSFIKDFPIHSINSLTFDQYVIGHNNHAAFCHRLERELGQIGGMRGSTSNVFGLYFGKLGKDTIKKDRFTKKYGETKEDALKDVLNAITELLLAGLNDDYKTIESNKIAELFKYKLLGTYYPNKYLNLYSYEHLNFFISMLGIEPNSGSFIEKQQVLFDFRDNTAIMLNWSNLEYNHFLYTNWSPPSEKNKLKAKETFNDTSNYTTQVVELEILPLNPVTSSNSENEKSGKPDYEKINRRNAKYGKDGELIVLAHENEILKKYNLKAIHTSVTDDYAGYDIKSFEADKTPKLIEVKSTTSKVGETNFIITDKELQKAKILPNYHIYIVFEVNTKSPKIWKLGNPFKNDNTNIRLTPKDYNIFINSRPK